MASTITFKCYSCSQVLKVGADKAGKKAKCIKCGTILTIPVESDEDEVEEVRSGPPRKPSARDDEEDDRPRKRRSRDDDEDDEDDRPRSRRARNDDDEDEDDRPRKRRSRADDEDDEDDRPRSRRRRDDDDDEDDDYDRPRKRGRDRDDDDDEYDRPRRKKGGGGDPWPKVGVGLLLNFISSIMLMAFAAVELLFTLLFMIAALATSPGMGDVSRVLVMIAAILFMALEIPALIGYIFSIFAPNKKGALGFAITVIVLSAITLVFKILWFMIPYMNQMGQVLGMVSGLIPLTEFATSKAAVVIVQILVIGVVYSPYIIYPLFMAAVAKQLKERYLQGGCMRALGFGAGAMGVKIIVVIILIFILESAGRGGFGGPGKGTLVLICLLRMAASGVLLVFAIFYMRTLQELRSRLD